MSSIAKSKTHVTEHAYVIAAHAHIAAFRQWTDFLT